MKSLSSARGSSNLSLHCSSPGREDMSLASGVEAEAERDSSKRDFVNRCELNSSIIGLVFCGNGCEMN